MGVDDNIIIAYGIAFEPFVLKSGVTYNSICELFPTMRGEYYKHIDIVTDCYEDDPQIFVYCKNGSQHSDVVGSTGVVINVTPKPSPEAWAELKHFMSEYLNQTENVELYAFYYRD